MPPRFVKRAKQLLPPVLRQLPNHAVALVADELDDVSIAQDGLARGAYLEGKGPRTVLTPPQSLQQLLGYEGFLGASSWM